MQVYFQVANRFYITKTKSLIENFTTSLENKLKKHYEGRKDIEIEFKSLNGYRSLEIIFTINFKKEDDYYQITEDFKDGFKELLFQISEYKLIDSKFFILNFDNNMFIEGIIYDQTTVNVKIIRNYNSENEVIQENIQAKIQSGLSFFDIDIDIKKGDYIISPNRNEPLIVENIWVYGLSPDGHKEVILTLESQYNKSK